MRPVAWVGVGCLPQVCAVWSARATAVPAITSKRVTKRHWAWGRAFVAFRPAEAVDVANAAMT